MKVLVLGWMRMTGTGKESKKPYDFAKLYVANQIREKSSAAMTLRGDGFEQGEVQIRVGCEGQFQGLKFPLVLELKIDHELGAAGKIEPVVTGFVPPAALKSA